MAWVNKKELEALRKRVAELEIENDDLQCVIALQSDIETHLYEDIADLKNQIDELNKKIAELQDTVERKDNGKYSLYLIKKDGTKWFDEMYSVEEMMKVTGISRTAIMNSLTKGEPLKGGRNAKYDSKYVGSRVVNAD